MIPMILAALTLGALGAFHCVGMCGPLALALPVVKETPGSRMLSTFLYNAGRAITYASLGGLLGLLEQSFSLIGLQQALSVTAGLLILLLIMLPAKRTDKSVLKIPLTAVRKKIGLLFQQKTYAAHMRIGLLNGLLPCGLVYIALAAATAGGSIINGAVFMAAFGLGTLPMMWAFSFFGSYLQPRRFMHLKKIYPVLMFGMGVLLIARGIGLHIPFIGEATNHNTLHEATYCNP